MRFKLKMPEIVGYCGLNFGEPLINDGKEFLNFLL